MDNGYKYKAIINERGKRPFEMGQNLAVIECDSFRQLYSAVKYFMITELDLSCMAKFYLHNELLNYRMGSHSRKEPDLEGIYVYSSIGGGRTDADFRPHTLVCIKCRLYHEKEDY